MPSLMQPSHGGQLQPQLRPKLQPNSGRHIHQWGAHPMRQQRGWLDHVMSYELGEPLLGPAAFAATVNVLNECLNLEW